MLEWGGEEVCEEEVLRLLSDAKTILALLHLQNRHLFPHSAYLTISKAIVTIFKTVTLVLGNCWQIVNGVKCDPCSFFKPLPLLM